MSLALGFIVCPPSITRSTSRSLKIASSPSPAQMASMPISFFSASRLARMARFCSSMFSIFTRSSSPSSSAYESATPGVFVCTCTFTSSRSPMQMTQSPICMSFSLSLSMSARVVCFFKLMMKNSVQ